MTSARNHISRLLWLLGLCAASAATAAPPWQQIVDPGPVVGMDGKPHRARCSGFPGTDPKFSFWTRKTASKNLVVYFEGGGACWDTLTCSSPQSFYQPQVQPGTDPGALDGIFNAANPSNPVRDWNFVYIPYCTGDIHVGATTKVHPSVTIPGLGELPAITIEHRGFDNFMVVLDWMRKNFTPDNMLVAGVSAGGYGATANSPWVARAFPKAHMSVVADASLGVTPPSWDQSDPGRNSWNPQLASWVFGPTVNDVASPQLMRLAAQGQPKAKLAQFTTVFDEVQIGFYGAMKLCHLVACDPQALGTEWYSLMAAQLVADATQVGNYRHYVAYGSYHVILDQPQFYLENTGGPVFSSWLADMLAGRGGRNGAGGQWFNTACPGCIPGE